MLEFSERGSKVGTVAARPVRAEIIVIPISMLIECMLCAGSCIIRMFEDA
jgi:hypothetical protein